MNNKDLNDEIIALMRVEVAARMVLLCDGVDADKLAFALKEETKALKALDQLREATFDLAACAVAFFPLGKGEGNDAR